MKKKEETMHLVSFRRQIDKKRLVELFCELAKIKSPSGNEKELSVFLVRRLKTLGLEVVQDKYGNVIGKLKGFGTPLVLCAHMDTVAIGPGGEIKPVVGGKLIKSDGTTILGADNKDSIAVILELLTLLKETGAAHRALEIVFTKEEEAISRGAENLDCSLLIGRECVISDHCSEYGTIVQSAPYNFQFQVKVLGKRAHVKAPEEGVNAIAIASRAISAMPLGRVDKKTTANIAFQVGGLQGVVDAEDKRVCALGAEIRNTIPDLAMVYGEVRGTEKALVEKALQKIERIFMEAAVKFGGQSIFTSKMLAGGYSLKRNNALIRKVEKIFKAQGATPELVQAIGGSDANVLNNRGFTAVVISSAHRNNHQLSEYLIIDDLVKLVDFYYRLITIK